MSNHEEHPSGGNATSTLSVIVPVYNEAATIREALARITRAPFTKEIIVVDDGSTDGARALLESLNSRRDLFTKDIPVTRSDLKILFHHRDQGKGASIRTALSVVSGDSVLNDFLVPLLRLERHFTLPWGMSLMAVGRKVGSSGVKGEVPHFCKGF